MFVIGQRQFRYQPDVSGLENSIEERMVSHGERRFDDSDVWALADYAARMDARLRTELGEPVLFQHTDALRQVAEKIRANVAGEAARFTLADADVIWKAARRTQEKR
jgi:hypothetical protein